MSGAAHIPIGPPPPPGESYMTVATDDAWPRAGVRPRQAEYLIDRGVDLDVARERGYATILADNEPLPGRGWSRDVEEQYQLPMQQALTLPLYDLDSEQAPQSWQIRFDTPRTIDGRAAKFETPGGKGRAQGDGTIPIPEVHPSQREHVRNPDVPLLITEGVVKGDSIISALRRASKKDHVAVTSITGVWMGFQSAGSSDAEADRLIGAFAERIPLDGRDVILVWDADSRSNPGVAAPLVRFGRLLEDRGARVRVARIMPLNGDAKAGVDDHLAAGADIVTILDDCDPLAVVQAEVATLGPAVERAVAKVQKPRPYENENVTTLLGDVPWLEEDAAGIWRLPGTTGGQGAIVVWNEDRQVERLLVLDPALAEALGTYPKRAVDVFQIIMQLGCGGDWKAAHKLCARFDSLDDLVRELISEPSADVVALGQPSVVDAIESFRADPRRFAPVEFDLGRDEHGITTLVTVGGPNHGIRLMRMERMEDEAGAVTFKPHFTNLTTWVAWRSRVETTRVIDDHGVARDAGDGGKVTVDLVRADSRMFSATFEATRLTSLDRLLAELDAGVAGPSLPKHDRFVLNALRQLGFDEQERASVYTSTGWTMDGDGRPVYLGGPQGGVSARGIVSADEYRVGAGLGSEEGSLTPFQEAMGFDSIPETLADRRIAAESIRAFLAITPKRPDVGVAVLGALFAAPLRLDRRAAVMLAAQPQSRKSVYASRLGAFFSLMEPTGSDFSIDIDGASAASAASTALWHVDAVCMADDFRLDSSAAENAVKRGTLKLLAQGSYSGAGRQRATQQGGNRALPKRRDVTVITAEIPDGGLATLSRLVVVPIDRTTIAEYSPGGGPAPVDDWVVDHAITGNARRAFADYLRWLAERAEAEGGAKPLTWLRSEAGGIRQKLRQELRHARAGEVVAVLGTGWEMMRRWATERGFADLLPTAQQIRAALDQLIASSAAETAEANPGVLTVRALAELLQSGRLHLTASGGKEPTDVSLDRVGWRWDPNATQGDGGWRAVGEHGGYVAIDGRVVITSAGMQAARRAAGLIELKMAQIAAGLEELVSAGTTPNAKIPARLLGGDTAGAWYRPQGSVFDAAVFGLVDDADVEPLPFLPEELA